MGWDDKSIYKKIKIKLCLGATLPRPFRAGPTPPLRYGWSGHPPQAMPPAAVPDANDSHYASADPDLSTGQMT